MAFCRNCGKEINENSEYCIHCGAKQSVEQNKNESAPVNQERGIGLAVTGLVFSILGGWIGLILAIIGMCLYKPGEKGRIICFCALLISVFWAVLGIVLAILNPSLFYANI